MTTATDPARGALIETQTVATVAFGAESDWQPPAKIANANTGSLSGVLLGRPTPCDTGKYNHP